MSVYGLLTFCYSSRTVNVGQRIFPVGGEDVGV